MTVHKNVNGTPKDAPEDAESTNAPSEDWKAGAEGQTTEEFIHGDQKADDILEITARRFNPFNVDVAITGEISLMKRVLFHYKQTPNLTDDSLIPYIFNRVSERVEEAKILGRKIVFDKKGE